MIKSTGLPSVAKRSPLRDLEEYINCHDTLTPSSSSRRSFTQQRPSPTFSNHTSHRKQHHYGQIISLDFGESIKQNPHCEANIDGELSNFLVSIEKNRQLRMHKRRSLIQNMFADIDWENDFDQQQVDIVTKKTDLADEEYQTLLFGTEEVVTNYDYEIQKSNPSAGECRNALRRMSLDFFESHDGSERVTLGNDSKHFMEQAKAENPYVVRARQTNPLKIGEDLPSLSSIHRNLTSEALSADLEENVDLFSLAKVSLDPVYEAEGNLRTPAPKTPKSVPIFT